MAVLNPVVLELDGRKHVFGLEVNRDVERQVQMIWENLRTAQTYYKSYVGKRIRDLSFKVRNFIYLKVSPMRGTKRFKVKGKLAPSYIGPFHVQDCKGEVAIGATTRIV
jgi:hypothetical protein